MMRKILWLTGGFGAVVILALLLTHSTGGSQPLIAISTGVEDVAKLNVPVEVGRRLIQCYDDLGKE